MAEAQAAGVRVLSCELGALGPGEALQMRLLLDYSILELFFGTGEVLTTRVRPGVDVGVRVRVCVCMFVYVAGAVLWHWGRCSPHG
jgi:hypothetical protein